jgi:hypothetical protein
MGCLEAEALGASGCLDRRARQAASGLLAQVVCSE